MKLRIIGVLTLLTLFGCSNSPRERILDLLQRGYEDIEKFDFEKAQEAFDNAAAEEGAYAYDKYGKALILEQQRFYYDAMNEYFDLADFYNDSALANGGLYRTYTQFGYFGRALEVAATYYGLAPQSEDAAVAKVQSNINAGRPAQALRELEKIGTKVINENTAKLLSASALAELNDFDSCQLVLQSVKEPEKLNSFQNSVYADALQTLGLIDSAMVISRKSIDSPSSTATALYRHFDRALENNYYDEATHVKKVFEQRGAGIVITVALQVDIAKDRKNFIESRIVKSDFVVAAPKNVSSIMFDMKSGGDQYNDPLLVMSQANSIDLYMATVKSNVRLMEFAKIQVLLYKANTDDRIAAWKELSALKGPMATTKQVTLTEAYLEYRIGMFDEALKKLKSLRNMHVNNPDWLAEIGNIYAAPSIRKFELALETYDEALKKDDWNREAFTSKIKVLREMSRFEDALSEFDKFPHFERELPEMALLKALCLVENNQFDKALAIVTEKGKFLKGNVEPFRMLVEQLERKSRHKEILKISEICSGWAGDNDDILLFASRVFADHGEYARALELADKMLSFDPGLIGARVQKGRALYGQGERTQAMDLFEQLVKEDPVSGDVSYYYSQILAKEKIDRDRTTNMARSALRAFYSDEKALINICQVYGAFGLYKFAYGDAKRALSEFPNSAELNFELGLASYQLNRANTDQYLKKAIELGLDGEKLTKAKEILASL